MLFKALQNYRTSNNLSSKYISQELNIDEADYLEIESGGIDISISLLFRIAEALNTELTQLFELDNKSVFNFNNNNNVQVSSENPIMNISKERYMDKYIKKLETEILHLKNNI